MLCERWGKDVSIRRRPRVCKDNLLSCTIITAEACDCVRDPHYRMTVMLGNGNIEDWLAGGAAVPDAKIKAPCEFRLSRRK